MKLPFRHSTLMLVYCRDTTTIHTLLLNILVFEDQCLPNLFPIKASLIYHHITANIAKQILVVILNSYGAKYVDTRYSYGRKMPKCSSDCIAQTFTTNMSVNRILKPKGKAEDRGGILSSVAEDRGGILRTEAEDRGGILRTVMKCANTHVLNSILYNQYLVSINV